MKNRSDLDLDKILEYVQNVHQESEKYFDGNRHYIDNICIYRIGDFLKLSLKNERKGFAFIAKEYRKTSISSIEVNDKDSYFYFINGKLGLRVFDEPDVLISYNEIDKGMIFNIQMQHNYFFTYEETLKLLKLSEFIVFELYLEI